MSGLETNLKNTRPRSHHLETETETETFSQRPRPTPISRPSSLHSTQLSQTKEDSIIFNTFTIITNLLNTIITADVNAHTPFWYSATKDHRGELIEDILLNSNNITQTLPTRLPIKHNNLLHPTSPQLQQTYMMH